MQVLNLLMLKLKLSDNNIEVSVMLIFSSFGYLNSMPNLI